MPTALALSLAALADRRVLAVLGKSALATVAIVTLLSAGAWWAVERTFLATYYVKGLSEIVATVAALVGAWLLFRLVALAVIQFFADEVVIAVEQEHYPEAAMRARPLGLHREMQVALRGFLRSLGWNLAALPVALLLLVTGVGSVLLFGFVNAVLLGRELTDMVRLRHEGAPAVPAFSRFLLGAVVVALLAVPFVNFLAPVIGAAAATHLVHRRASGVFHAS
ncbi:EI24 domain-containing protein [Novosphingobium sp. ZN18A2]|uniref:EI24 domain-containing protein n=1 Tax=Novosphingobium sp. ZN18A2 TaxID=3079861 RepID=UPI0030D24974